MRTGTETRETRGFAAEVKFLVENDVADKIRSWARARLGPDPFGAGPFGDEYHTLSLYFDTQAFDVFRRRGSYGRSKFRIRRYGESDVVFLERKLRTSSLVSKRRTIVGLNDLMHLNQEEIDHTWPGPWFHRRLLARRLGPSCQVSYRRTARVTMTNQGPVRLTLDEDLRARPASTLTFDEAPRTTVLDRHVILELKHRHSTPTVFKELVEEFKLKPQKVSKYRLAVAELGLDPTVESAACQTV